MTFKIVALVVILILLVLDYAMLVVAGRADRRAERMYEECGCFLDTYCEHQIYDRNPDGTINIVECGYEPKTEPTISKMEQVEEPQTERSACDTCQWYNSGIPCGVEPSVCKREVEDEPQTDCDHKCVQTEIGCEQTDCAWK